MCLCLLFSHKLGEILLFVTTWMNLEDILLSERRQTQEGLHCVKPRKALLIEPRELISGCQMLEVQRWGDASQTVQTFCYKTYKF